MGHGSNDKLYITHTEHSGQWGQHTAGSSGFKAKSKAPTPLALTPFDCCSLSLQPFEHPVCARNEDGTGTVFDLVNIIPWLKHHDNKHPTTGTKIDPSSLIKLNYARDPKGEIHDPVSFKRFSEHSHIVAISTTGNVFLHESIKGNRDLVADVDFKKEDVITLQNPYATALAVSKATPTETKTTVKTTIVQKKAALPWNASPYSTGLPGASLTSTSVDPHTASSTALYDEEELMFDAIANPPKGKGKEKDVGKRRAYVRVVTTLGGTSLNLELYCEKAPKTCYNFLMLAKAVFLSETLLKIQTGDPTGTGSGGQSHWGTPFRDEFDAKNAAKHDSRGIVAMANKGPSTNGYVCKLGSSDSFSYNQVVFGKLVGGEDVLDALEQLPRKEKSERPAKEVRIKEVVMWVSVCVFWCCLEQTELSSKSKESQQKEATNDMNWFGMKLGSNTNAVLGSDGGGVGKYLDLKRPRQTLSTLDGPQEKKKQKTLGFGDFSSW